MSVFGKPSQSELTLGRAWVEAWTWLMEAGTSATHLAVERNQIVAGQSP